MPICQPAEQIASVAVGVAKEVQKPLKDSSDPSKEAFPAAAKCCLVPKPKALMTHLSIEMRAGDLIVTNGREPAWPATQRSVVTPSSAFKPFGTIQLLHASCEPFREEA